MVHQTRLWKVTILLPLNGGKRHLKAKVLERLRCRWEGLSCWGAGRASRCAGICTVVCSPAWSTAEQFTAQINKQLKFSSKGRTEMNTQLYKKTNQCWEQQRGWDPGIGVPQCAWSLAKLSCPDPQRWI